MKEIPHLITPHVAVIEALMFRIVELEDESAEVTIWVAGRIPVSAKMRARRRVHLRYIRGEFITTASGERLHFVAKLNTRSLVLRVKLEEGALDIPCVIVL